MFAIIGRGAVNCRWVLVRHLHLESSVCVCVCDSFSPEKLLSVPQQLQSGQEKLVGLMGADVDKAKCRV